MAPILFGTVVRNGDVRMRTVERIMRMLVPAEQVRADPSHPLGRMLTREYRQRREVVRQFWLVACGAMLLMPVLHWVVAVGLFTTFVSFMYLDEAPVLAEQWFDRR